jgi:phasin family protein
MGDRTFDMNAWFDASRSAFAPLVRAHQEAFKTFERVARHQYAATGSYLDTTLAHVKSTLDTKSGTDLLARQTEFATQLFEKTQADLRDLVKLFADGQATFADSIADVAKSVTAPKKAA